MLTVTPNMTNKEGGILVVTFHYIRSQTLSCLLYKQLQSVTKDTVSHVADVKSQLAEIKVGANSPRAWEDDGDNSDSYMRN